MQQKGGGPGTRLSSGRERRSDGRRHTLEGLWSPLLARLQQGRAEVVLIVLKERTFKEVTGHVSCCSGRMNDVFFLLPRTKFWSCSPPN